LTAATPAAGLPASRVPTVGRSGSSCSLAASGDSAHRVMPSGLTIQVFGDRIDDTRLAEIFAREVLAMLVLKELLSPEWAERILFWPHSGFNVHSHLFIARVTSHFPDKGQVMVRYCGPYANVHIHRSLEADLRGG